MIATRFVPAICVLFALAIIPTVIHSYAANPADDGRRTTALPVVLAGMASTPSARNSNWGQRRFDSPDWTEREFRSANGETLTLTVVRSYDAKALYHHPELAVAYGTSFVDHRVQHTAERPDVPVHVLVPGPGVEATGVYVLHYDTRFISDPIRWQLRNAGELLVRPRKPMTLFFVRGTRTVSVEALDKSAAVDLLFASVDAFLGERQ
jgi:hypothetical protein